MKISMSPTAIFKKISSQKKRWIRGFLFGFAISVFISILALLGHFRPYEHPFTSVLQKTFTKNSSDIVLLFITEDEYKKGFGGYSPLSRERLSRIVDVLVKLHAKVIAIDIDFSDKTNEDSMFINAIKNAKANGIPVVIPSNLNPLNELSISREAYSKIHPYFPEKFIRNKEGFILFSPSVLQKKLRDVVIHGGSNFSLDNDGIFRSADAFYHSLNDGSSDGSSTVVSSFPLAIAAAYHGLTQKDIDLSIKKRHHHHIELELPKDVKTLKLHYNAKGGITPNFIGNYEHFQRIIDPETLLKNYEGDAPFGKTLIENKIVIVGGVYDKNDFYTTPAGWMSGMEIIANITQSISDQTLISHLNFWKAFIFEISLGAVAALFFILFSPLKAFIYCFIALIPSTIVASLVAFSSTYYWIDFIPTIAGVMLHGVISKIEANAHNKNKA